VSNNKEYKCAIGAALTPETILKSPPRATVSGLCLIGIIWMNSEDLKKAGELQAAHDKWADYARRYRSDYEQTEKYKQEFADLINKED
jgi:hypothetical protein